MSDNWKGGGDIIAPYIETTEGVCGGRPCIEGTRIEPSLAFEWMRAESVLNREAIERVIATVQSEHVALRGHGRKGREMVLCALAFEAGRHAAMGDRERADLRDALHAAIDDAIDGLEVGT